MNCNDLVEDCTYTENSRQEVRDIVIHPEKLMTSEQSKNKAINKSFVNLTQRTNIISEKLAMKRQQLQLSDIKSPKSMMTSDKNALETLQTMEGNDVSKIRDSKSKRYRSIALPRPLKNHSKEQLEDLVKGFQVLILNLTSQNRALKAQVKTAAKKIRILKDFPIFLNENASTVLAKEIDSTKEHRKDKDAIQREKNELSHKNSEKLLPKSIDSRVQDVTITVSEKQEPKQTQEGKFVKYINKMIRDYLGTEQQTKLEKVKCSPANIEDLETFANVLVEEGLGSIVEKEIRINRKNNIQAFISMTTDREADIKDAIITSPVARHYALEGDIVRAFVLNTNSTKNKNLNKLSSLIMEGKKLLATNENEKVRDDVEYDTSIESEINDAFDNTAPAPFEKDNCRKAFVIKIIKQSDLREIVGSISFMQPTTINSKLYYNLRPHDAKIPMIFIPEESCTEEINNISKEEICGMIYLARILDTNVNGHCIGELMHPVGKIGNLEAEIKAILFNNKLKDIKPYEKKFEAPMPPLSDKDLLDREDLRKKCVFTIDPLTAKDLDDAVSIEKLNDFEYEIGVHISDVSFYLEENSELDNIVKQRATSIYLVTEVIHMLPTTLCFRCSLLPGEDKFAFSVFWKWNTEKEEISTPRFTRSIINSCTQFAYEHAQKIIDNPNEELGNDDIPNVLNNFKANDIKWRVLLLHQVAQKLKAKRYENGALSINNPKLRFQLDPKTGEPLAFEVEGRQEANFLIEEFMLLANQSVAKFIHDHFPEKSILRSHPPPLKKSMKQLKDCLDNVGLSFDITSSKTINDSMQRLIRESEDPNSVEACLNALLVKPMAKARYFCTEGKSSDVDFWHFALSIPIYTHFTSPIRRYPDIMVHRLLAAALNYCPPPQRDTVELHHLAAICNEQKLNAKNAGDESIDLFFKRYLKAQKSITLRAVVTEINDTMINVVTIGTGHSVSIIYKEQNCLVNTLLVPKSIELHAQNSELRVKLQLFSTIDINIVLQNDNKICGFFAVPGIQEILVLGKEDSPKRDDKLSKTSTSASKSKRQQKSLAKMKQKKNQDDYASFYAVMN